MADFDENRRAPNGAAATALVPGNAGDGSISFVQFALQPPFDERLIFWQRRDSDGAAAFRLLRQRLIEKGDPRTVLCTSALRHEGKTTLASNLALAYAELGKHRVLLLEAGSRGTALGEVFGFKPPRGFGWQMALHRDRPADPWVVVQIAGLPLYVMAGEPHCCPHCSTVLVEDALFCGICGKQVTTGGEEPIDARAFAQAVRRFRESFDYLILDAPSVLGGGDVNLIQDAADTIVFATRKGRSEARNLRRAIEQVAPAQIAAIALLDG